MKLRFWRKDRHIARPTGGTGSGDDDKAQPKPNLNDPVPNDTPDSARSEESAFGIKVLVPGKVPLIE